MGFMDRLPTLLEEWMEHQRNKAADYNGSGIENADVLGARGQFADIWRKIWKLKKGLWDGEKLIGEQPREILLDLIGHCFLTIDMLDRTALPPERLDPELVIENSMVRSVARAKTSDRERLRLLTGHGWDGCAICRAKIKELETAMGRGFDWQEDIP